MDKLTLQVSGMSCGHCEKAVVNALTDIGAAKVTANAKKGWVEVTFDPAQLTVDAIKKEIAETGYTVA